ncbi:MAG: hypothetical protein ACYTG7_09130 [Planctomycetota bacterium]|jgi:hypothetical protein
MLRTFSLLFISALLFSGCAFHIEAREWNGCLGQDGKPVYYVSTSKMGMNLLIFIPILGDHEVDGLVDELTEYIKNEGGDNVRLVTGDRENYWYGFSPVTWIFTPVVSTVAAEYHPSPEVWARDRAAREARQAEDD